jgi:hypothetical protein
MKKMSLKSYQMSFFFFILTQQHGELLHHLPYLIRGDRCMFFNNRVSFDLVHPFPYFLFFFAFDKEVSSLLAREPLPLSIYALPLCALWPEMGVEKPAFILSMPLILTMLTPYCLGSLDLRPRILVLGVKYLIFLVSA